MICLCRPMSSLMVRMASLFAASRNFFSQALPPCSDDGRKILALANQNCTSFEQSKSLTSNEAKFLSFFCTWNCSKTSFTFSNTCMSELTSFKRRLTVLEAADASENNSLNLKSPSMLWKIRVMMPAMLCCRGDRFHN